jgi:hypothetical protein
MAAIGEPGAGQDCRATHKSNGDGAKHDNHLVALLPGGRPPEKQLSKQVDRRKVRFDNYNIA